MILDILLVTTATMTALMAGLFYAWSCSVMLGFARLSDREFVSVMQKTNRAIQNPVFFAAFLGAPIFLLISTVLHYNQSPRFSFLLMATIIYLTGTFGVTIFGNVPMNNTLDRFDLESAKDEEIAKQRANFERRWNNLNKIRTVSSTVALIFVVIACLTRLNSSFKILKKFAIRFALIFRVLGRRFILWQSMQIYYGDRQTAICF